MGAAPGRRIAGQTYPVDVKTHPRGTPMVAPVAVLSMGQAPVAAQAASVLTSMSGRTVLVPDSALTTNGALAALLDVGARPLVVPLSEARPVGSTTRLDQALTALGDGRYGWLALSSAASVRMLDARARTLFASDRHRAGLRRLVRTGRLRVAAVGQATEAALTALDVHTLVPERGSGPAALIGPLLGSATGTRVLFARGNLVGPALVGALRGGGIDVDEVVTHITLRDEDPPATTAAAWVSGLVDAVLLTSPRAVRGMIDRLGPPRDGIVVGCMDGVTAEVARASGVRVDVVGTSPTVISLVDALEDAFSA